ncbi:metallophosphoesterase [Streptomyces turgidiscabies]|uniref:Ser/Thr phosphatase family protein n=1 Tax=Streptomyces turgidiscabies (strain Car8) TaxID=698760 RepID=L7EX48_STRT8|nr:MULTISPECIES: metallophosphoesterase [Streptomyces]ELP63459.1 Ser/Thr phosphatase family protein [Streptomyces turgidiscabies Car8]MDX3497841.1 metallophosphoesterase [Streptomyces turgidiscabies]GAQ69744.1 putative metallophosphoesterase [Streptomyces turgidiscabies]
MVIVFLLAGLAALAALVGLHWYVWRRLVRDTTAGPGPARRAGTVVFVALPVMMVAALAAERGGAPFWLQRTLAWPGFLWLALFMYLGLALIAGEFVRPLLRRFLERRGAARAPVPPLQLRKTETVPAGAPETPEAAKGAPDTPDTAGTIPGTSDSPRLLAAPSRRLFVSRVVAGSAAAVAAGTVGYGTYGVLRGPRVKRVTVPLAKLPRGAHGFRIAVVSDIHLGPVLGRGFAQKVVDTINSTQPDLIAVVGDLVDGSVKDLGPAAAPLAGLRARHGAFFVTGNHEYFSGAEQWVEEVRRLGLRPLENARVELPAFDLAGVNDIAGESEGQGPDFTKALGDRDTSRASVLLAHQPVQIHDAVEHGVDLQLSGHTHGGQLWPGNFVADLANPTLAGLERYGDTQLYVSRGAGAWGPPTRVGAPSDITVVELASGHA